MAIDIAVEQGVEHRASDGARLAGGLRALERLPSRAVLLEDHAGGQSQRLRRRVGLRRHLIELAVDLGHQLSLDHVAGGTLHRSGPGAFEVSDGYTQGQREQDDRRGSPNRCSHGRSIGWVRVEA